MPRTEYREPQPAVTHVGLRHAEAAERRAAKRQLKVDRKLERSNLIAGRQAAIEAVKGRLFILEQEGFPESETIETVKLKRGRFLRKPKPNMLPVKYRATNVNYNKNSYAKIIDARPGYLIPQAEHAGGYSQEVLLQSKSKHILIGDLIDKATEETDVDLYRTPHVNESMASGFALSLPQSDLTFHFVDPADSFDARGCKAVTRQSYYVADLSATFEAEQRLKNDVDVLHRTAEHLGSIIERNDLAELVPLATQS